jgi:hypothetical protein
MLLYARGNACAGQWDVPIDYQFFRLCREDMSAVKGSIYTSRLLAQFAGVLLARCVLAMAR